MIRQLLITSLLKRRSAKDGCVSFSIDMNNAIVTVIVNRFVGKDELIQLKISMSGKGDIDCPVGKLALPTSSLKCSVESFM